MITREEFNLVGCGSVLRFDRKRGPSFRTVVIGPSDHVRPDDEDAVYLPIMHRSWTRRACTVLFLSDLNHQGAFVDRRKNTEVMSANEIYLLLSWCDKPSELIQREIQERSHGKWRNSLRDPLAICRKLREMRNTLRWASI